MLCTSDCCVQVNRFLQQQGMRKEEVEREMERAYEQYFSSLARKVYHIQASSKKGCTGYPLNNPAFLIDCIRPNNPTFFLSGIRLETIGQVGFPSEC